MPQPDRIDRYEILRKLATGGMAELFLAKQTGMEGFEKVVVLKRILAHLAHDQEFVSMFLDEARIAAMLSHANIVQIYDLGRAEETYYIAMEYVSGRNMAAIMRKARETGVGIPIEHTCRIVTGVADGLYYAHTRKDYDGRPLNIIHRDISPQNILVSFQGGVKLVDFGIAKASTQLAQTRAGVLKGKYAYMSPEQVRGDKIDHRSDVFAVGVVMYEFLTGQRPFERETSLKTLKAIVQEKPLNPREINPEVPIDVVRILSRALEKNPDRRYPNAQELQLALEDYLDRAARKSNNVRLSRWLYELFDDELNADGGTMIVKGIGEIIVPTGQSSEEAEKPKIDEIPEGTVRAALAEIQARHDQPDQSVSIVTDEKTKPPVFDASSTDALAMAAPVSTDPESRSSAAPSMDDLDDEETGPGVAAEDDIPDTVMQPAPEPPPDHPRASKGNGKPRTRTVTESLATTEQGAPSPPAHDDATGEAVSVVTARTPDDKTPPPASAPIDAASADDENAAADAETNGDFSEDQPPTVELDRAALMRGDIAPPRTSAADMLASSQVSAGSDGAAAAANADADEGEADAGENGDAEQEIDGATIPAYDPSQFGVKAQVEEAGKLAAADDDQQGVETVAGAPALRPLARPDDASAVPELPHVEEAETASLSPAEVRRILDRVESLRQQAAASDAPASSNASGGAEAATAESVDNSDAEETAANMPDADDGPTYSANTFDATVAQPEPVPPGKGGNGAGRANPEYAAENYLTVPEETLGFETTEPGEYEEGGKRPAKGNVQAAAVEPSAEAADLVAAGGVRITRRRATDAEIRDRKIEQSGHQLNVPPIDAAMPPPAAPSRPGSAPKAAPMQAAIDLAPMAAPVHSPPAAPLGTSAESSLVEEVSRPAISRPTHSAANARLLLVLMILLAVAAGLVVLYVVLFSGQTAEQTSGGGNELGSIVLRTTPPGAQIWLDTRKQDGVTPVQIGGISYRQQHMLRFALEGYEEEKVVFDLPPGDSRTKLIEVTLTKLKK